MNTRSDHKLSFTNDSDGRFFAIGADVRISIPYSNYRNMVGKIVEIKSALIYIRFNLYAKPMAFHFDEVDLMLN